MPKKPLNKVLSIFARISARILTAAIIYSLPELIIRLLDENPIFYPDSDHDPSGAKACTSGKPNCITVTPGKPSLYVKRHRKSRKYFITVYWFFQNTQILENIDDAATYFVYMPDEVSGEGPFDLDATIRSGQAPPQSNTILITIRGPKGERAIMVTLQV